MCGNIGQRHGTRPKGQRRRNNNHAGRLVEDHGLKGGEAEEGYQKREAKLGTSEADKSAKGTDASAHGESAERSHWCCVHMLNVQHAEGPCEGDLVQRLDREVDLQIKDRSAILLSDLITERHPAFV